MPSKNLKLKIFEAKQVLNVSGPMSCSVQLVEGKSKSSVQESETIEENNNPSWDDAEFNLYVSNYPYKILLNSIYLRNTDGFDFDRCNLVLEIISGNKVVAYTKVTLNDILHNLDQFESTKKLRLKENGIVKVMATFTGISKIKLINYFF